MIEWEELSDAQKQALKLISENSLLGFQRCFFNMQTGNKWISNWHHKYVAHVFEEVIAGKRGSVIINMPPGSSKTEIASIHAPAYSMIKCDKIRNLNLSFSNNLVETNSLRIKDIIKSEEFQELWPKGIAKDKADHWQTTNEKGKVTAEIVSRSLSGQITGGRGGHITTSFSGWVLLDDPDKPEDMFSEVKRLKNHNIMINTIRSRAAVDGEEYSTPFIVVQQRLHVDDTTAFLTDPDRGIGVDFDVIKIPALIDEDYINSLPEWIQEDCRRDVCSSKKINGKWSFWPKKQSIDKLMAIWEKSEYTFMSQYMQEPISLGGSIFDSSWFRLYSTNPEKVVIDEHGNTEMRFLHDALPDNLEYRFITADTANTTKSYSDYSVICEWGVKSGNLYLLDMLRKKMESAELRGQMESFVNEKWSKNNNINGNLRKVMIENKSSGIGLVQELKSLVKAPVVAVQRTVDKVTRALDVAPHIKMGKVYLPAKAQWLTEFLAEHSLFTHNDSHKHDDIVDNTCDAVNEALMGRGKKDLIKNIVLGR